MSAQAHGLPGARAGSPARRRDERALRVVVGVVVAAALATAVTRVQANPVLAAGVVGLVLVAYQRVLLAWQTMLAAIVLVILFVPIRRYTVAGGAPIELEPYRVLIALVFGCWLCALAADPAMRWRRTGLEAPAGAVLLVIVLSMAVNLRRVAPVDDLVLKQVSFFVSYVLIVFFVATVLEPGRPLDRLLRLLVAGGTLVAVLSLIEWRTGTNLFNWYGRVVPVLDFNDQGAALARGTGVRAMGSAQHPIALSAALILLLPLAVYLFRRDGRAWWMVCAALLVLGALSTGSRTGALMLVTLLASFLWIKPAQTLRLVPLVVPLAVVVQLAMPGTLGTFRAIMQPSFVIQEQSVQGGSGSGRIADLGPSLREWSRTPVLGQGFGTRLTNVEGVTTQSSSGAPILDDQWLGLLLETGAAGVLAILWLFARAIRRLARAARRRDGPDGWLLAALAAALLSLTVGMFTFDAFSFIQVTFLGFILLGLAAVALRA